MSAFFPMGGMVPYNNNAAYHNNNYYYDKDAELERLRQLLAAKDERLETKDIVLQKEHAALCHKCKQLTKAGTKIEYLQRDIQSQSVTVAVLEAQCDDTLKQLSGDLNNNSSSTRRKRPRTAASVRVVQHARSLRKRIFPFVGPQEHIFTAGVSKIWRQSYMTYAAEKGTREDEQYEPVTHWRAAILSPNRLQWGFDSGLRTHFFDLDRADGKSLLYETVRKHSSDPIGVLTICKLRDMSWEPHFVIDAAYDGNLALVRWLISSGCPAELRYACCRAILGRSRETLQIVQFLSSRCAEPWSQGDADLLLRIAGCADQVSDLYGEYQTSYDVSRSYPANGIQLTKEVPVTACCLPYYVLCTLLAAQPRSVLIFI